ncbi:hypothetical protein AC578_9795 [Pseudocercospora eumusae]|uniref:Glutaredoxin domain-containing protein n=1 Tax=Pseudocercospora eumusae TaxID=321146 RepID=A0A139GUP7_9PEZI|nr:hypothetical protein AC578_9795 [Pseudocercospora eumusae]
MPSQRQIRAIGLVTLLALLVIYYVSNGAKSTYDSPFYKNTVAAIEKKKTAAEREQLMSEEKDRLERVERLRKEHDVALEDLSSSSSSAADATKTDGPAFGPQNQKPIKDDSPAEKSVAGRKKMGTSNDKIVKNKPKDDTDDGVAKVGNVAAKATAVAEDTTAEEKEHDRRVELELNNILKKGPIIVFSKSYCPFSKKAKHILLDLYNINPPPYVVELDQHELGPGLQLSLARTTGRRTVPNVLINGKSIGGGDDIEALHNDHKLIDKVTSMGGKRIMSIRENAQPKFATRDETKAGLKFKV